MPLDPHDREYRSKYQEPTGNVDRIDELRKGLYSRIEPARRKRFNPLKPTQSATPDSWGSEARPDAPLTAPKHNFFLWFFMVALIGCVGAVGYAGYRWYAAPPSISPDNVDIQIVGPVTVDGGDPFSIQVVLANNNAVELELADLILEFPDGTKASDGSDLKRLQQSVGIVRSGEVIRRDVPLTLYGNENSMQNITARLVYHVANSGSVFEKEKTVGISLGESPLAVVVSLQDETTAGQRIDIDVDVTSNAQTATDGVVLSVEYPFGFTYLESSVKPLIGTNNVFEFERLDPGVTTRVRISGTMDGTSGDVRAFKFATGIQNPDKPTTFTTLFATDLQEITLTKPFLGVDISFGTESERSLIVDPNGTAAGRLYITNNTPTEITNVALTTKLDSKVLNRYNVTPSQGFYRSIDNTIVWDTTNNPSLARIAPGQTINLGFTFETLPLVNGTTLFQNPEIILTTDITGRRLSQDNVPEALKRTVVTNVKVNSQVELLATPSYFTGPFTNTGPLPPKPEQETTYTVTWKLSNTSNQLSGTVVTALLPNYMSWKNIASPDGSKLSYDSANRTITWSVGEVAPGVGHGADAAQISFQVGLLPSLSQLTLEPELVRNITLRYLDRFTQSQITTDVDAVDTNIDADPGYETGMETVTQ